MGSVLHCPFKETEVCSNLYYNNPPPRAGAGINNLGEWMTPLTSHWPYPYPEILYGEKYQYPYQYQYQYQCLLLHSLPINVCTYCPDFAVRIISKFKPAEALQVTLLPAFGYPTCLFNRQRKQKVAFKVLSIIPPFFHISSINNILSSHLRYKHSLLRLLSPYLFYLTLVFLFLLVLFLFGTT